MPDTMPKVTHVNYPDVAGWEWTGESWTDDLNVHHDGLEHSLVWDKHNHTFMYSTKSVRGDWIHTRCRGEYWEGKTTIKLARELALDFIKGPET